MDWIFGEQNLKAFLGDFNDQEEAIQNLFVLLKLTTEAHQRIVRDLLKQKGYIRGTIILFAFYPILFYQAFILLFSFILRILLRFYSLSILFSPFVF